MRLEFYHYEYKPELVVAYSSEGGGKIYSLEDGSVLDPGSLPALRGGRLRRGRVCYAIEGGEAYPVEVRGEHYYKLLPVGIGEAPTLEIDGIHMHRVKGSTPWRDSRFKVELARVKRGSRVLDVGTGLGYTAVQCLLKGAEEVDTIEADENVLWIASRNPWSRGLADERVNIIVGRAEDVAGLLPKSYYDRIIHDPPRLTRQTGTLYSLGFHRMLYELLKPGGVIVHYTGEPGRKRGLNLPGRVASRLRSAGFHSVRYVSHAQCVIASK